MVLDQRSFHGRICLLRDYPANLSNVSSPDASDNVFNVQALFVELPDSEDLLLRQCVIPLSDKKKAGRSLSISRRSPSTIIKHVTQEQQQRQRCITLQRVITDGSDRRDEVIPDGVGGKAIRQPSSGGRWSRRT